MDMLNILAFFCCPADGLDPHQSVVSSWPIRWPLRWKEIQPRHWLDEAKKVDFPDTQMQSVVDDMIGHVDTAIETISKRLPKGFPGAIADPIFTRRN